MRISSLGYRTDVMIRVLEGGTIAERDGYLTVHTPAHPDFWWGNFLLMAAPPRPGAASTWLARFAAEFPGAGHVALGIDVTGADAADTAEFVASGLALCRSVVMTAATVRTPRHVRRDIDIRPLAGDGDWLQAAALRAACFGDGDGGPATAFCQRRIAQARTLTEAGHGAWFGAFAGDRLTAQLGLVWGSGDVARFQDVETHPTARRQGLAGTLVHRAGRHVLSEAGTRTLVIVADPAGPAIRLYRSLGFEDREDQIALELPPPGP